VKSKKYAAIIAVVLVAVLSLLFLIVDITALFVTAYIFALLGIAGFLFGTVWQINGIKSYPWATAIPLTMVRYLITEVIVSAVFVLFEQIGAFSLPIVWFILIQVVILAVFAVRTLTLKAGQEIIENRGAVVA
jgi:hypothetical protein